MAIRPLEHLVRILIGKKAYGREGRDFDPTRDFRGQDATLTQEVAYGSMISSLQYCATSNRLGKDDSARYRAADAQAVLARPEFIQLVAEHMASKRGFLKLNGHSRDKIFSGDSLVNYLRTQGSITTLLYQVEVRTSEPWGNQKTYHEDNDSYARRLESLAHNYVASIIDEYNLETDSSPETHFHL